MKKVVLLILDGLGYRKSSLRNAVRGNTRFLNSLLKTASFNLLGASGTDVGLPAGYMGNSEVGHLNLGAGKHFKEIVTKINENIHNGGFYKNKELLKLVSIVEKNKKSLHLIGMWSEAGIHSHLDHLKALIKFCKERKLKRVFFHVITDGRDTSPQEVWKYIKKVKTLIKNNKDRFVFATISGRYYAMDRDKRWSRTAKYYHALYGSGRKVDNINEAVTVAYRRGELDEFISPTIIGDYSGIVPGDGVIFFNFREDRMRQIVSAVGLKNFNYFRRKNYAPVKVVGMYDYDKKFNFPKLFEREKLKNTLGEVISKAGGKQLRIAETEKYAHVTYFFNGGEEDNFKGESRVIIPSPHVKTYDLKPEMSAKIIRNRALKALGKYDFMLVNFANCDMVGHTGNFKAACKAVQIVDECMKEIVEKCRKKGIITIITADHGNCENMLGQWKKSHTLSKVPFFIVDNDDNAYKKVKVKSLSIRNVAPTVLKLMGLKRPSEMDAETLF